MSRIDLHSPAPGETTIRRTSRTSYSPAVPWLPLILAALLVPLLLTALATLTGFGQRDSIENDLAARSGQALTAAGISGGTVSFSGRDATISGVSADDARAAEQAVGGVEGVRVARAEAGDTGPGTGPDGTGSGSDEPAGPAADTAPLAVAVEGRTVTLGGAVPDDQARAALVEAAESKAAGRTVVDNLTVDPAARPVDAKALGALVGALASGNADSGATFAKDSVTLTGAAASAEDKAAAAAAAGALAPGSTVDNQLTVSGKSAAASDRKAVQRRIDTLLADRPITFLPDSADLTASGAATVRELSRVMKAERGIRIEVGGHVARTPGDAATAQRLSVQRAATVKALLGRLGISAGRVSAKGFGDSEPIASNSTTEGQAANRRVEIDVL